MALTSCRNEIMTKTHKQIGNSASKENDFKLILISLVTYEGRSLSTLQTQTS